MYHVIHVNYQQQNDKLSSLFRTHCALLFCLLLALAQMSINLNNGFEWILLIETRKGHHLIRIDYFSLSGEGFDVCCVVLLDDGNGVNGCKK